MRRKRPLNSKTSSDTKIEAMGDFLSKAGKAGYKNVRFKDFEATVDEGKISVIKFLQKFWWILILTFILGIILGQSLMNKGYRLFLDNKLNLGPFTVGLEDTSKD